MRKETPLLLAALAVVTSVTSVTSSGCGRALAQSAKTGTVDPARDSIELVVYAGNFAMVRELRKVELPAGRGRIGLQGVSKSLDQHSVLFNWPSTKDAKVVSSTYDLGMSDSGHLLERFLGKEIELVYRGDDGKPGERVKGTLEVAEPGNIVVKADGKYIVNPNATIEAPTDSGIVTIPQLSAEVESKSGGNTDLAVSYMTGGLSWSADYTATLSPDADEMQLECWATVTNQTGTDFPDAKISFVAGAPNRLLENENRRARDYAFAEQSVYRPEAKAQMNTAFSEPQQMGEMYAYPYKSTATIRQDQMNRVRMMGSEKVTVKRVYAIALPNVGRDWSAFNTNPDSRIGATLGLNFTNAEKSGLGLPLPAGAIRIYEPDKGGAPRYIGASSVNDTPKDARINMTLTNVFDVYARAREVSAKRIDKRHTSRTVEITVSNEKSRDVEVRLVQNFDTAWKLTTESSKSGKLNAWSNQWKVRIPAGGETKLRYTVVLG